MNTTERNTCEECANLESVLNEKDCEIKKLQALIKKLKSFLLDYETQAKMCKNCPVKEEWKLDIVENTDNTLSVKDKTENKDKVYYETLKSNFICEGDSNIENSRNASNNNITSENENTSDYIYDANLKMYYCPSTGYYYDHKSGLFYLPQTRSYYSYNYTKGEYELCGTSASDELVKDDCDSVLDKVSDLNICDNEFGSTHNDKFSHNFLQVETVSERKEILDDALCEGFSKDWKPTEGSNATIQDLVRNVAEQTSGLSDYIYDEKSAMYYSPSTGHYYDPVKKLLYDPHTATYYLYIEETGSYEFYCKADEAASMSLIPKYHHKKKNYKKKQWRKKVFSSVKSDDYLKDNSELIQNNTEDSRDSLEEGEILSTSDSDSESDSSSESASSFGPPCIRAIVKKSEKLRIGSLILITCSGAIIGREKFNTICVSEIGVSKAHAEIIFNSNSRKYTIEDLGSQNGTFVNDIRLSVPKQKSEPLTLNHGDILTLGTCELLLHIHEGLFTCDKCEPGQVLAEISAKEAKPAFVLKTKAEKEKERREEKNRLKKKYGLKGDEYVPGKKSSGSGIKYEDKADIRRKTVGSQNPYEKTEAASMHESISNSNKGFQMLKKLGWNEGDTLGLNGTGLSEPIPLRPWLTFAGLGCTELQATSRLPPGDKRKQRWVKAQERYLQLTQANSENEQTSDK
ncbi:hypothetical protein JTE90_004737 [Oedothorax gibbosus]|uniref:Angiogenic factor with G patch and FHA domains 1 n=1 Tax=Oedothorax gibbosus TaxID=931172 RepID=A0AAV6TY18_9ARAC|nr:hypothetical protein JTE90_004737 [Oedothorax gibbosus]